MMRKSRKFCMISGAVSRRQFRFHDRRRQGTRRFEKGIQAMPRNQTHAKLADQAGNTSSTFGVVSHFGAYVHLIWENE